MFHEVWWKKPKKLKNPTFFYFHGNCGKVCPIDSDFFGLWQECDVDVDVTGNITAKLCEVWSEFNFFCTLVTMTTATILNFFNPQKLQHTTVDIPTKFHDVWWKESKFFLNPPFFVSMATVAMLVQPIPIFFSLSRSTRCGCCFCSASNLLWSFLCFFNFLAFWPFPWQRQPFWKKSTLKDTTSHGIWYSYKVS